MQFSTLLAAATFSATVFANLHNNAVCVDSTTAGDVYNTDATVKACAAYLARQGGSDWHETCPDCIVVDYKSTKLCNSAAEHLGGNEINAYCQEAGASYVLTS